MFDLLLEVLLFFFVWIIVFWFWFLVEGNFVFVFCDVIFGDVKDVFVEFCVGVVCVVVEGFIVLVLLELLEVVVEVFVLLLLFFILVVLLELLDFLVFVVLEVVSVCDRVLVVCLCWFFVWFNVVVFLEGFGNLFEFDYSFEFELEKLLLLLLLFLRLSFVKFVVFGLLKILLRRVLGVFWWLIVWDVGGCRFES